MCPMGPNRCWIVCCCSPRSLPGCACRPLFWHRLATSGSDSNFPCPFRFRWQKPSKVRRTSVSDVPDDPVRSRGAYFAVAARPGDVDGPSIDRRPANDVVASLNFRSSRRRPPNSSSNSSSRQRYSNCSCPSSSIRSSNANGTIRGSVVALAAMVQSSRRPSIAVPAPGGASAAAVRRGLGDSFQDAWTVAWQLAAKLGSPSALSVPAHSKMGRAKRLCSGRRKTIATTRA